LVSFNITGFGWKARLRSFEIGSHEELYSPLTFLGGIAFCSTSDSAYFYTFLRSVICLSSVAYLVCLSHSFFLLKPFDGFICHFAGTGALVGSSDALSYMGDPDPPGAEKIWG